MSNVIIRGGVGMLKEQILDVMFRQRCKDCNGFVFLINHKVQGNKVSGTTECANCLKQNTIRFYLKQNKSDYS